MKVNGVLSFAGSPLGCILSLVFFVFYTNACQSQYVGHHIITFADDSVIVAMLSNDYPDHGPVVI